MVMTIGSLFSGIGGIELGFHRQGFQTKWFIEKDKFCQKILTKNFPNIPIYEDVKTVKFEELERVDILTGGFPCQDISIANPKGKGIKGERSSHWKYFAKAIGILRPKYAIIENVSALTIRGLCNVLEDLAKEGYDAEWFDLRASDFGAIHKRERIFIIAYNYAERHITAKKIFGLHGKKSQENEPSSNGKKNPLIITHDWSKRIQRFREKKIQEKQGFSWCKNVRRIEDLFGRPDIPQPLIRGNSDGIPFRIYRTKALGNAVIPEIAEFIAERIKKVENARTQ